MTLAASGAISLGGSTATRSINLELGQSATAQVSMNDSNVRTLAGVPSGAIVMPTNFYGKGGAVVNFIDANISSFDIAVSIAEYRVNTNGFDYQGIQGTFTVLSQWVTPSSAGGDYEIFATRSGDPGGGTTGSWVATSTSPTWSLTSAIAGVYKSATLSMQVRKVGTGTVLDTWTVFLEAERL